jgi:uncharacterized membrane protein HdeD (DUF308 family)
MMADKSPNWLRFLQIGLGAISILLSVVILTFPGIAIYTIIIILSVVLLMIGFERIAIGAALSSSRTNRSSRWTNIGLGALVTALGIVVMSFPIHTAAYLIFLGALALLFNGIARIVQGIINKEIPGWSRAFLVGVGVLCIGVSTLVIAHPISIGLVLLALVISVSLLINGIQMIASGIGGRQRHAKSQVGMR